MRVYADGTKVDVSDSRAEIEKMLVKYGADQFLYGWDADQAAIGFRIEGRQVKMVLPFPSLDDPKIRFDSAGRRRSATAQKAAHEQASRERWRLLVLAVKSKLASVAAGLTTIEREFLADIVLPDGSTFGQWARPQLDRAYLSGQMPPLLPGLGYHTVDDK